MQQARGQTNWASAGQRAGGRSQSATVGWLPGVTLGLAVAAALAASPPDQDRSPVRPPEPEPVRFVNVAQFCGIDFTYYNDPQPNRFFIPEIMGGGASWLDYDGDGWQDLFLVNGCVLPHRPGDRRYLSALYRNTGGGRFVPVTPAARVEHNGYGQGCTAADWDNDGFDDLVVTTYGLLAFYRNNGDGTFSLVPDGAGLHAAGKRWFLSAAPGDVNGDGSLDLYVTTYAVVSLDSSPVCYLKGVRIYCGPEHYTADRHFLFLNQGDGRFRDVTAEAGCLKSNGRGMAVTIVDFDNDRRPEVLVGNDMSVNWLFHNLGVRAGPARGLSGAETGRRQPRPVGQPPLPSLEEIGMQAGVALTGQGDQIACMGFACADYDGDGRIDIFLTNYHHRGYNLFQNLGKLLFMERSRRAGLTAATFDRLGFAAIPLDYDLDGRPDLFVANGHVLGKGVQPFEMRAQLFHNQGDGVFKEVSEWAGAYFFDRWIGRGAAWSDYTNDGRASLAVVHQGRPAALLRNDTEPRGHWLGLVLTGTDSPRNGIGTQVKVHVGDRLLVHQVVGGGSYLSESDHRLLVGLGSRPRPDSVEVLWPSGRTERLERPAADQYWQMIEGRGLHPVATTARSAHGPGSRRRRPLPYRSRP